MPVNLEKMSEKTRKNSVGNFWKYKRNFILVMLGIMSLANISMSESVQKSKENSKNIEAQSKNIQEDEELYSYNLIRSVFKPKSKEPQPDASPDDNDRSVDVGHQERLLNKVREELADYFANPSKEEAERHMVWVEVPVWRLQDGKKVSDTERIQVLNVLASDVKEIFREIYNGHEKFPIKRLIG